MGPVRERQPSQEYQCHSDYPERLSSGAVLSRYLSESKVYSGIENVRDKNQFCHLARQVYPEDSHGLFKAYLDSTELPHGYVLLDLSLTGMIIWVSNLHLPVQRTTHDIRRCKNETNKFKLPRPSRNQVYQAKTASSNHIELWHGTYELWRKQHEEGQKSRWKFWGRPWKKVTSI